MIGISHRIWAASVTLALLVDTSVPAEEADNAVASARSLLLRGRYEESAEEYSALIEGQPVLAALGLARCRVATGNTTEARQALTTALEKHPQSAPLLAELAVLAFEGGDHTAARAHVDAALKNNPDELAARWIDAELLRTSGKLKEADAAYKWLVDHYNNRAIKDPDALRWIGLAAAQFARFNRVNEQFKFLINDLYPDCLAADEEYWPARYEAGQLFLEKYNQADATREFKAALKINPNAADVHAALAHLALQNYDMDDASRSIERALEINPKHLSARHAKADWLLAMFKTEEARALLEDSLALNPRSEETLGRLGAVFVALDGWQAEPETRLGKLISQVQRQNPRCGVFYFTMATRLADRKKFTEAEPLFKEAIQRMPQLTQARGELGLMYMRLGEEVEAEKLLKESFEIDPFNVRVSNMLKVLEVLSGYATLETEHFIIRFDRGKDELLARYAGEYLEEVYPQLCRQFAFEPQGKSLFEIFSRARNTDGHGWFSARMVGLPYIGTVGACAGKMVALTSPNDMDQKYNWARVLKHEFIHVLNLQQTNFNIPHWFTEALAVINEGYPRSEVWDQLLAARVPAGEVFNLDDINLGFIRPKSSLDWQMAYCQAELYAEYMLATFGEDALAKMLAAYRDNLSTRAALQRSFGVEQEAFERGYVAYVKKIVADLSPGKQADGQMTLAELVRAQAADPDDPDLAAKLAYAQLSRKAYPEARQLSRAALKENPKQQLAAYVLARIHLLVGDAEEALTVLEAALDPDEPEENLVNLLAALKLRDKQYDEAAKLYQLASRKDPSNSKWTKALARVYLETGDQRRLAGSLEQLVLMDADEFVFRKKLAQMALDDKDYTSAARWAREAIQIDVQDASAHMTLARSLWKSGQLKPAIAEYQTATQLDPKNADARVELARTHLAAEDPAQARKVLEELLKLQADHQDALQLLKDLPPQ